MSTKTKAQRQAYYQKNRDKIIAKAKKWQEEHPQAGRTARRKYAQKKKNMSSGI